MFEDLHVESIEQVEDTDPDLYLRRAELCVRKGQLAGALKECDKAIAFSGGAAHYQMEKIKILHHFGKYRECAALLEAAVEQMKREFSEMKLAVAYLYFHYSLMGMPVPVHELAVFRGEPVTWKGQRYAGQWSAGDAHGIGVMFYGNGEVYAGQWRRSKRHGNGTLFGTGRRTTERWYKNTVYSAGYVLLLRILKVLAAASLATLLVAGYWLLQQEETSKQKYPEVGTGASIRVQEPAPVNRELPESASLVDEPELTEEGAKVIIAAATERLFQIFDKYNPPGWKTLAPYSALRGDILKLFGPQMTDFDVKEYYVSAMHGTDWMLLGGITRAELDLRFGLKRISDKKLQVKSFAPSDEISDGGHLLFDLEKMEGNWVIADVHYEPFNRGAGLDLTEPEAISYLKSFYREVEGMSVKAVAAGRGYSEGQDPEFYHEGNYVLVDITGDEVHTRVALFTRDGFKLHVIE